MGCVVGRLQIQHACSRVRVVLCVFVVVQRRVQKKRHEALENARKQERMAKHKEDRRIRQEIVRVSRGVHASSTLKKRKKKKRKGRKVKKGGTLGSTSGSAGHFFMTSLDDESTMESSQYAAEGPATSVPSSPELDEY